MEKEIVSQIVEVLEKSGHDQLWYLIALFVGVTLVNLGGAVYTTRLVDRYKNELKKKEVKFSVYNQIQIEKMSELFELSHELKCCTSAYVSKFKKNAEPLDLPDQTEFIEAYDALSDCFSKNRYIFPQDVKAHFKLGDSTVHNFRFNVAFLIEKIQLSNIADEDFTEEIELTEQEIGDYRFDKGSFETMLFCEELKVLIETHFSEWE